MEISNRPPKTMREVYQLLPEGTPVQLINNKLLMSPAPKDRHQKVLNKINRLLADHIEKNSLGETRIAPSDVFINDENIFQPDIYYISNENLEGFRENGFHGTPDLIIEILSPGSEKQDTNDKFKVYESCGVKEYWIVDPDTKTATGYTNANGRFVLITTAKEKLPSKLLDTVFVF